MGLRLIIEDDEGATTIVPLAGEAVTIGRQDGNTIQLTEKNVSRKHARLTQHETGWIIEDLDSYNGVKVNGVAIEKAVALQEGDVVQIGDYHLALSDNVERKTLNIERAEAANSDDEPVMVSSSASLPKLSPEELAELQHERDQGGAAAAAMASGAVPALSNTKISEDEEPRPAEDKGGAKYAVIAVAVVGVLGFAGWMMLGGGDEADETGEVAAAEKEAEPPPPPPEEPEAVAGSEGGEPEVTPPPEVEEEIPSEPEPEPEGFEELDPEAFPDEEPTSRDRKRRKKRRPSRSTPPPPPSGEPPPPPTPDKDPRDLLNQARKAQLQGNNQKAYSLAKEAYGIQKSSDAAKVMGVAACKMGDANKAKSAYKKLSGSNKENLAKVCSANGIEL